MNVGVQVFRIQYVFVSFALIFGSIGAEMKKASWGPGRSDAAASPTDEQSGGHLSGGLVCAGRAESRR